MEKDTLEVSNNARAVTAFAFTNNFILNAADLLEP
jgi:hypothetical protein